MSNNDCFVKSNKCTQAMLIIKKKHFRFQTKNHNMRLDYKNLRI